MSWVNRPLNRERGDSSFPGPRELIYIPATMVRRNQFVALLLLACAQTLWAQQESYRLPDKKGTLLITSGMKTKSIELVDDDSQLRVKWISPAHRMIMTAFVQPAEAFGDARICRDTWWPQVERSIVSVVKIKDKTFREQDGVALVEYMVPKFEKTINQKHVHAYLAGGDVWVEVHISKDDFKPEDQALFDAILRTLHLQTDHDTTSRDYWRWGAIASNQTEYEKAAKYFQKSLDLEKNSPALEPEILRRMIADLGLFYETSGDLAKAKETLEYGLSRYPDYPLYHYNMACVIAHTQKMDESLAELRLAYANPKKYPEDQARLDPRKDECFSKFAKEQKFMQAVREIQQQH
jgi:tetratricopeptide (TPR) repeat protein